MSWEHIGPGWGDDRKPNGKGSPETVAWEEGWKKPLEMAGLCFTPSA